MFRNEAQEIGNWLGSLPSADLTPLLNLGSGTTHFRTRTQPWVDEFILAPLRLRGVEIVNVEIREGPGIDLSADILSDEGYAKIAALRPRFILLANVLEHVYEPAMMVERCLQTLSPGGRLLITVPRSYPRHTKIDTMLRPTPEELAAWAPEGRVERSLVLETEYHWQEIFRNPRKAMLAKFKWLFAPYTVSMLLLAKP
jgi:SAM-dependent methyltransferase